MKKNYLVSVDSGADFAKLTSELRATGAAVEQTMDAIGVISLAAEESLLPRLKAVRGVRAVEESGGVNLPPPESPVQ